MLNLLKRTRELIERGWTQGSSARDADGQPCDLRRATCFCLYGALTQASYEEGGSLMYWIMDPIREPLIDSFIKATGIRNIVEWNDDAKRTKEDVLNALDETIKAQT